MTVRRHRSEDYNWNFNTENGVHIRWGKKLSDDPQMSPVGPEILDIEVSTICHGPGESGPCKFCYKSNTSHGKNMTIDNFKTIIDKIPDNLTQVAFGVGDIDANPHLIDMFKYCKSRGIVPNITINGGRLSSSMAQDLAIYCGSVAVSAYNLDVCYDTIRQLGSTNVAYKRPKQQLNIHVLLSEETYDKCMEVIDDCTTDSRLQDLNALIFLALKPKGVRNTLTPLNNTEKFKALFEKASATKLKIGFDSCSAPDLFKIIDDKSYFKFFVEPCETSCFSGYVNVDGEYWHCSFAEGNDRFRGIDLLDPNVTFMEDVWNSDEAIRFRRSLNREGDGIRKCPLYDINITEKENEATRS